MFNKIILFIVILIIVVLIICCYSGYKNKYRYKVILQNYCTYIEYHCSKVKQNDYGIKMVLTNGESIEILYGYGQYESYWNVEYVN